MPFPRLYAILDAAFFRDTRALAAYARELSAAGVTLMQYRNKQGFAGSPERPAFGRSGVPSAPQMLADARELRRVLGRGTRLIMNDRADLCLAADCDGVHLGQDDLSPQTARAIARKPLWVGVSTHTPEQIRVADQTDADYLAIGPVFATASKLNPDPIVGLEGVHVARALTRKPLVAIGGITRANCRSVIEAGADCVAVISDLLNEPRQAAEEFLRVLG